jgi:hypothetical protein
LFHTELSNIDIVTRYVCKDIVTSKGQHPRFIDISRGKCKHLLPEITEVLERRDSWQGKITLIECAGWPVTKICSQIRRLNAKNKCDVVIIDYIQNIPRDDIGRHSINDAQALSQLVQILKQQCLKLSPNLILVIMSQLNNEGKTKDSQDINTYTNVHVTIDNPYKRTDCKCINECLYPHRLITRDWHGISEKYCPAGCIKLTVVKNSHGPAGEILPEPISGIRDKFPILWHDRARFRFFTEREFLMFLKRLEQAKPKQQALKGDKS